MDPYPQWTICLLLALCCALLSAGRTALTALTDSAVRKMSGSENARERFVANLLEKPADLLDGVRLAAMSGTFICAITAYRLFSGLLIENLLMRKLAADFYLFHPQEPAWLRLASRWALVLVICVGVVFLLDVLCSQLPSRLAGRHARAIALGLARFCWFFSALFRPFVRFNALCARLLARLFGVSGQAEEDQVTEEEIRMMVDVGNEKGAIEQSEKDMINNIFEFDDRYVSEVMTHRTDVVAVPRTALLEEIVSLAIKSGYSRIPLYEDGIDKIIGIVYVKDLLCLIGRSHAYFDARDYMRKALFIPENMGCVDLFTLFKLKRVQLAVAVDEYGGTAGVVTMEDLLESIVGNIQDEYDDEEEEVHRISDNCYLLDGAVSIDEVERLFDMTLDAEDESEYDTIGGLLTDVLGRIPAPEEHPSVELDGVRFTVAQAMDRRIARVRAERPANTGGTEEFA